MLLQPLLERGVVEVASDRNRADRVVTGDELVELGRAACPRRTRTSCPARRRRGSASLSAFAFLTATTPRNRNTCAESTLLFGSGFTCTASVSEPTGMSIVDLGLLAGGDLHGRARRLERHADCFAASPTRRRVPSGTFVSVNVPSASLCATWICAPRALRRVGDRRAADRLALRRHLAGDRAVATQRRA